MILYNIFKKDYKKNAKNSITTSSFSRPSSVIEQPVYRCHRANCWTPALPHLHSHSRIMTHKRTLYYKCSSCNFSAKNRSTIKNHVRQILKAAVFHKKATSRVVSANLPNNPGGKNSKSVKVPVTSKYYEPHPSEENSLKINPPTTTPVESLESTSNLEKSLPVHTKIMEPSANLADVPKTDESSIRSLIRELMMEKDGIDTSDSFLNFIYVEVYLFLLFAFTGLDFVPSGRDLNVQEGYSISVNFKLSDPTEVDGNYLNYEMRFLFSKYSYICS